MRHQMQILDNYDCSCVGGNFGLSLASLCPCSEASPFASPRVSLVQISMFCVLREPLTNSTDLGNVRLFTEILFAILVLLSPHSQTNEVMDFFLNFHYKDLKNCELTLPKNANKLSHPDLLFLVLSWKKARKTTEKARIISLLRTLKTPRKEGENHQKSKEFLAKGKSKEIQKSKEKKIRAKL